MNKAFLLLISSLLALSYSGNFYSITTANNNTVTQHKPTKYLYEYFPIKKFVDGDTFWIDNGTEKGEKIRLIGIDAPESRNMFNIKKEAFGTEASEYIKQLLQGKKVRLEYDVDKYDRYGRTLAYAYLEDGTFLNAHLVENGYAMAYTVPPNVKYAALFIEMQRNARENKAGLWSGN
ncbi:thermonuclease family protein [Robertkochia solimangrovi]|uniref:thermonuclease family protein n=1 Tax=Robertkochia solimangrovi TaxID=2213046 RepID=UPI00117D27F2|nr:thermonuclease family protein [Robertkochia solimangrovi]TRZ46229.1 nuclease [Robertkochia solimangrovi]